MIKEFAERKVKDAYNGPSYVLMLQIARGERSPIPFGRTNLSSDRVVAIIDEYSKTLYLWFGKNCSEMDKRLALNAAESIRKIGCKYDQFHVGHSLKNLKIIDESKLNEPENKDNNQEFTGVFNRIFKMKDKFLVEVVKDQFTPAIPPVGIEISKTTETKLQETTSEFIVPEPPATSSSTATIQGQN
ncbi:MAG: hypothetical protein KIH08_01665 [Candidatus Freyarchaeota archaeon]|nr:hypothetical protein [Candidatus Jordarchaeia archaeon]MBS7268805.1 hypothetical protein [Candidatus Jordarchaeia archaeon]MBS7279158.1 hypothetical protein [Candidatus Jordarchaeia archaeon]